MPSDITLEEKEQQGDDDDDDAQRGGKVIVGADFAHKLGVDQDREGFKAFADEHRCAEIGKDPHKDQ